MQRYSGAPVFRCALLAAFGLSGCGGGSAPSAGVAPQAAPTSSASTTTTQSVSATFAVTLQQYTPVALAARHRRPAFVSPATASLSFTLVSVNGQPSTGSTNAFAVGPSAPNCSAAGGAVSCNFAVSVPVGNDVLQAQTLDTHGTVLGSSLVTAAIVQNATNRVPLAIGGSIAALQIFLSQTRFTPGTPADSLVVVVPLDSSGAEIVNPGNYSPAITVTSSYVGTSLSLITDGTNTGRNGTLNSPSDQVVLAYDGVATSGSTTITANAGSGITASAGASINAPGLSLAPGGANVVAASTSFVFSAGGQAGTVIASGGTGPYTIATSDATVATVSGTSPNFTVSAVGYGTTGTATVTVTDSAAGMRTIPVTFIAPPIVIALNSCGTQAACTTSAITFPQTPPGGVTANETGTIGLSGGVGTYSLFFASSGTTTSTYAVAAQAGNSITITPTGSGNDALVITSGNETAVYAIITGSTFAASLPVAFGINNAAAFSENLPATVTAGSILTGAPHLSSLTVVPGNPASVSIAPSFPGTGTIQFDDAAGDTGVIPFTVFGISFATYAGSAVGANAAEAFTAIGETDAVTVTGAAGSLTATSANAGIVTVSAVTFNQDFTVTAVGTGTTTIALNDAGTGATCAYTVSVTTTTVPISSVGRQR